MVLVIDSLVHVPIKYSRKKKNVNYSPLILKGRIINIYITHTCLPSLPITISKPHQSLGVARRFPTNEGVGSSPSYKGRARVHGALCSTHASWSCQHYWRGLIKPTTCQGHGNCSNGIPYHWQRATERRGFQLEIVWLRRRCLPIFHVSQAVAYETRNFTLSMRSL